MDRKKFLRKGLVGLGAIVAVPTIAACDPENVDPAGDCALSPAETAGPFPIKTPADLARENIISDRQGVPLLINLTIQDQSNSCAPLSGVFVDVWHCDAAGHYSQYGGTGMQQVDYTDRNFLRGRQTTNASGQVSFISIFPGWYPGRAPHIHLEVLNSNENSIRVTQIAFEQAVCDTVYATASYQGTADTQNNRDNIFSDSEAGNLADSVTGNTADGYTLEKIIIV